MICKRSDHVDARQWLFPDANQSDYSADNDPKLFSLSVDIYFLFFAAIFLQFSNKLQAVISMLKEGIDGDGRDFFS